MSKTRRSKLCVDRKSQDESDRGVGIWQKDDYTGKKQMGKKVPSNKSRGSKHIIIYFFSLSDLLKRGKSAFSSPDIRQV